MQVLVPNPSPKEAAGEMPITALDWNDLGVEQMTAYKEALAKPGSGVTFKFNAEEAKRLNERGRFNIMTLGGYESDLLGVTARPIVDKDNDPVVELVGQFRQTGGHPIKDNTRVGLILPQNIHHVIQDFTNPA